jgi:hypothetical protein
VRARAQARRQVGRLEDDRSRLLWAALLGLVVGGDGPGDQGGGHVAKGEDAVVEAAQAEGVAQARLGGGA